MNARRRHLPNPPAGRARARAGFSLIDLIAAILVISIALPPLLFALSDARRKYVDPAQAIKARWLAAEKLEDIIADRHSATRGYSYIASGNYSSESSVTGFTGFSRSVSITETGVTLSGSGSGFKTITVTVTYPGQGGTSRSLALSTVLTSYTP